MMSNTNILLFIIPVVLLPVFFAIGWFMARVDMKVVVKNARAMPDSFFCSLNALIEGNTKLAADSLNSVVEQRSKNILELDSYELVLSLGKLYRDRGENDKAIALHKKLLLSADIVDKRRNVILFELGLDFYMAGLVDRAEYQFEQLLDTNMAKQTNELLLEIYQQDKDWEKAIKTATKLSDESISYQIEIAQFYCELAQAALYHANYQQAYDYTHKALKANSRCIRASIILGDIAYKQEKFQEAIDAYQKIEKQGADYLSMVGENLINAYKALGREQEGLDMLIGYIRKYPSLDLLDVIYNNALTLKGEKIAAQIILEIIRAYPTLSGVHRILGLDTMTLPTQWRIDVQMMQEVITQYQTQTLAYYCKMCHFKSTTFQWYCTGCKKWELNSPNRVNYMT